MGAREALSQDQVDALVAALRTGRVPVSEGTGREAKAVPYNFRRPSRVTKDQVRGLQVLHEDFAKLAAVSLPGLARAIVDLELAGLEQTPFGEYQLAVAAPTCLVTFAMEPLQGTAVLEIGHPATAVLLRRVLGSAGFDAPEAPRDFTEIERTILEQLGARLLADLGQAWRRAGLRACRPLGIETNPQTLQVTSPNEVMVVATFRLRLGPVTGPLALAYPYPMLEPVLPRLGSQATTTDGAAAPERRAALLSELAQNPLTVRAVLGRTALTVGAVLGLRPGDTLWLDTGPDDPVLVEIEDRAAFLARAGKRRWRLAVELLRAVEEGGTRP
ncbi:MAG TPA: FliM/FliN family flagellar motor switch protein [Calidithermus sp.]|jgi:flagellar motor switch protein FliM|nr:FliM/FliN family flagellar motor switch protein [Calidithermus sp.]